MNIDLVKLFPGASKAKGLDRLVVNYFDIVQFETRSKLETGYNAQSQKEHKLLMREGLRHDFASNEGDKGIEKLTALRRAFNIIDTWNGTKDTLAADVRNSMEGPYKEAQRFVMWAHQKYI